MVLEAANGDPLRAMEMEEELNGEWWARWLAWHNARAEASKKDTDGGDESES